MSQELQADAASAPAAAASGSYIVGTSLGEDKDDITPNEDGMSLLSPVGLVTTKTSSSDQLELHEGTKSLPSEPDNIFDDFNNSCFRPKEEEKGESSNTFEQLSIDPPPKPKRQERIPPSRTCTCAY